MLATLGLDRNHVQTAVEARVLAFGAVRAWPERLEQYRKQPTGPVAISPSLLRNSESQTVAAVWAACEAAASLGGVSFADWGVIAGPCLLGRAAQAASLERFAKEGPWGISPHMIPHHSLHAVSGTISQIFQCHGPNFGVGNGPSSTAADAWLTAATLLSGGVLPGLWLVLTGHTDEYLPAFAGTPESRVQCEAAALALGPSDGTGTGLRIVTEDLAEGRDVGYSASVPSFTLSDLVDRCGETLSGAWRVPGLGRVEITPAAANLSICRRLNAA